MRYKRTEEIKMSFFSFSELRIIKDSNFTGLWMKYSRFDKNISEGHTSTNIKYGFNWEEQQKGVQNYIIFKMCVLYSEDQ